VNRNFNVIQMHLNTAALVKYTSYIPVMAADCPIPLLRVPSLTRLTAPPAAAAKGLATDGRSVLAVGRESTFSFAYFINFYLGNYCE